MPNIEVINAVIIIGVEAPDDAVSTIVVPIVAASFISSIWSSPNSANPIPTQVEGSDTLSFILEPIL